MLYDVCVSLSLSHFFFCVLVMDGDAASKEMVTVDSHRERARWLPHEDSFVSHTHNNFLNLVPSPPLSPHTLSTAVVGLHGITYTATVDRPGHCQLQTNQRCSTHRIQRKQSLSLSNSLSYTLTFKLTSINL